MSRGRSPGAWVLWIAAVCAAGQPIALWAQTGLGGPMPAEPMPGERTVTRLALFRDGTVLRLALPDEHLAWQVRSADGRLAPRSLRLSQVDVLQPSRTQPTILLRQIESALVDLGHENFATRGRAQKVLLGMPPAVLPILRDEAARTPDAEIRRRIRQLLAQYPEERRGSLDDLADRVQLTGEELARGDLGAWQLSGKFRGQSLVLGRAETYQIRRELPSGLSAGSSSVRLPARTARIPDTDEVFPTESVTRIGFDVDPAGKAIQPGTDIHATFVPQGFTIKTSIAGSIVSVNPYDVGGRSRGMSCATHAPRFQGELTIRFCQPGNAAMPAGVTRVGFWVAAVSPDGTSLVAYDAQDRQITEIKTINQNKDFLGLESTTPIAYIKIVPNIPIDPDYTIDDLVFDPPRPFVAHGHERLTAIDLRSGERMFAEQATLADGRLVASRLSIGLERVEIPADEVRQIVSPSQRWKAGPAAAGGWARLVDGTTAQLQIVSSGDPATTRLKLRRWPVDLTSEQIAGVWGSKANYREPRASEWPKPGEALLMAEPLQAFAKWEFGADGILFRETPNPPTYPYDASPPVWFRRPSVPLKPIGRLRVLGGEEYVLGGGVFEFESWTSAGVAVRWGAERMVFGEHEVIALLWE
jgi:hypothetical protein